MNDITYETIKWFQDFSELKNMMFSNVFRSEERIFFVGRESFLLEHDQDCCENVWIEDIIGELSDLENFEILMAEHAVVEAKIGEEGSFGYENELRESNWFKLATLKGYVTIRFNGTSNGYYSVSADLKKIEMGSDLPF